MFTANFELITLDYKSRTFVRGSKHFFSNKKGTERLLVEVVVVYSVNLKYKYIIKSKHTVSFLVVLHVKMYWHLIRQLVMVC